MINDYHAYQIKIFEIDKEIKIIWKKRKKYVHLTTQDNEYCHRFIKNYSNSTLETTESEIQNE